MDCVHPHFTVTTVLILQAGVRDYDVERWVKTDISKEIRNIPSYVGTETLR